MRWLMGCATIAILVMASLMAACQKSQSANADFAPGAFPPTLSATEYHQRAWSRTDCMTCHETGVQNAPKIKHVSVPDIAKSSKCRTCHVVAAAPK